MISADQLASMRTQMEASFSQTATRRRWPDTTDDYGNQTRDTGNPTDITIACRLVPVTGTEDPVDRDVIGHFATVLVAHDADVTAADALIIDSTTYEVTGPPVAESWSTHLRVPVQRTEAL